MNIARIAALGAVLMLPVAASADPLVAPGGKPAAAKSWTAKGNVVTIVLAEGFSAEDAAKAISANVPGAAAKADGPSTVIVSGLEQAKLLPALEKIEVNAQLDDVNQMFAQIQGQGGEDGSGSSIRATSQVTWDQKAKDPEARIPATVVSVKHGTYPYVAVTVKIDSVPKGEEGLKKGATVTVVPRINAPKGVIAPGDEQSKMNVGAWYVRKGDKVSLMLEGKTDKGFWVAQRFERLK